MKIDVLAVGELLADIISEEYVATLADAKTFRLYQGGSPSNVCANLKWMGIHAVMVSCVGDDGIGNSIINSVRKIGLTDDYIARSKTHPTTLVFVGRSKGTPDFIAYRMADTQIGPVDESLIEQSSIIHSCAFALSRTPAQQNILNAFSLAVKKSKITSVDWNFAPSLWPDDGKLIFEKVCATHPLLKMSMDDVERFLGKSLSHEEAKNFLHSIPTTITCLTCGKDGVWYKDKYNSEWKFKPAAPVTEVKDTTGAGDAFWSGFLKAFLEKKNTERCVQHGLEVAAKKIQKVGPLYGQ